MSEIKLIWQSLWDCIQRKFLRRYLVEIFDNGKLISRLYTDIWICHYYATMWHMAPKERFLRIRKPNGTLIEEPGGQLESWMQEC